MTSQRMIRLFNLQTGSRLLAVLIVSVAWTASAQVHAKTQGRSLSADTSAHVAVNASSIVSPFAPLVTYDSGGVGANSIAVADVNGDGHPDIVVTNQSSNNVAVLLGKGDGTFEPAVTYGVGGTGPLSVAVADVNGDGYPDIAMIVNQDGCSNNVSVLLNNRNGTFAPAVTYQSGGCYPTAVAIADINHDNKPALLVSDFSDGAVGVLLGNGDGTFGPAVTSSVNGYGSIGVAPLGPVPMIIVANAGNAKGRPGANVAELYPNADGTLRLITNYSSGGYEPISLAIGDVYPDGAPDIAVTHLYAGSSRKGNGKVGALLNEGGDEFVGPFGFGAGLMRPTFSAIGDINLDGIPDLILGNGDPDLAVLFSTGWGGIRLFHSALTFNVGGSLMAMVVADINGDGKPDVVVADWASSGDSLVGVLLNVAAPVVKLSPSSLNFGRQAINETSAAKTVTVRNNGIVPLNVSISVTGSFAVSANTCGLPVEMGSSCKVSVTFTPTVLSSLTGTLTFTDNASDSPQTVQLSGIGVEPATLTPTSATYSKQAILTTSPSKTFTLTNNQSSAMSIGSITFAGANPGDFAETNTCTGTLAGKGKCTIAVTFTPQASGSRAATLSVADGVSNSPQTASLTGTGEDQVTWTPVSLTFSSQAVGTKSAAKNVTLTNNLPTALSMNAITFTGANPGDFAETDSCDGSVGSKSKCTISVTFSPQSTGTRTATANINDSANSSPQTVSLTGTGK